MTGVVTQERCNKCSILIKSPIWRQIMRTAWTYDAGIVTDLTVTRKRSDGLLSPSGDDFGSQGRIPPIEVKGHTNSDEKIGDEGNQSRMKAVYFAVDGE